MSNATASKQIRSRVLVEIIGQPNEPDSLMTEMHLMDRISVMRWLIKVVHMGLKHI